MKTVWQNRFSLRGEVNIALSHVTNEGITSNKVNTCPGEVIAAVKCAVFLVAKNGVNSQPVVTNLGTRSFSPVASRIKTSHTL